MAETLGGNLSSIAVRCPGSDGGVWLYKNLLEPHWLFDKFMEIYANDLYYGAIKEGRSRS
jgi:hypothetical protein